MVLKFLTNNKAVGILSIRKYYQYYIFPERVLSTLPLHYILLSQAELAYFMNFLR